MIRLYHARGTRSVRVLWLCYEMNVSLDVETVPFTPEFLSTPAWRSISPTGKLPLMEDGDLKLLESGAILDYLLDRYDNHQFRPAAGTPERARYNQWCWMSEATLIRPLGLAGLFRSENEPDAILTSAKAKVHECLDFIDASLDDHDYLLGNEFSACDIMMGYSLELLTRFQILGSGWSNAKNYVTRLKERPACQKAISA